MLRASGPYGLPLPIARDMSRNALVVARLADGIDGGLLAASTGLSRVRAGRSECPGAWFAAAMSLSVRPERALRQLRSVRRRGDSTASRQHEAYQDSDEGGCTRASPPKPMRFPGRSRGTGARMAPTTRSPPRPYGCRDSRCSLPNIAALLWVEDWPSVPTLCATSQTAPRRPPSGVWESQRSQGLQSSTKGMLISGAGRNIWRNLIQTKARKQCVDQLWLSWRSSGEER